MSGQHAPLSNKEAEFLHEQGWSSGYGWSDQLDWYWEPSQGAAIWITDDPQKMRLWQDDRAAYRQKIKEERARKAALDLLEALEGLTEIIEKAGLDNLSNGVQLGPTVWYVKASDAMDFAKQTIAKARGEGQ